MAVLAIFAVVGAWSDIRFRRLPNWLCVLTAICGLLSAFVISGTGVLGSHALHMLVALVGGMVLFRVSAIGGGDAKFYAATAAWFPLASGLPLLITVALCGLVLLFIWFGYRRIAGLKIQKRANGGFDALPYGVAIGVGGFLTALMTFLNV